MEPENIRFGGGATETLLHPVAAALMLIAIVLILTLRREKVIVPFLLAFFTIPVGQVVLVGSVHFTALRILILVGLARIALSRGSSSGGTFSGGFNGVDRAVALWTVSALTIISLQWMDSQAFVKNLGDLLDALGGYLVVRFLIPDGKAIQRTIKVFAAICVIQGVCMISEQIIHVNVFGLLGGLPVDVTVRDGHIRSQGVMGCISAGVFAGILIPLFVWLWTTGKPRIAAYAGLAGAGAMAITSNSSTSLLAAAGSLLGLALWPLRTKMRIIRWGLVLTLVALHLLMHGPVWSLIARMDLTGSSSGYHRYYLVDNLIRHFSDWWLLGYRYYNNWGWEMWDTCNQFVAVALTGGLLTLALYILILKRSFAAVGNARKQVSGDRKQEWFLWCLGSALFASVVGSFGINFMAQLLMLLFPLLACISVASFEIRQALAGIAEVPVKEQFSSARGPAGVYVPFSKARRGA
jgi:hypothetical protein